MRTLSWLCCKPVCFAGTLLSTGIACPLRLYCAFLGNFSFSMAFKRVRVKVIYRFHIHPETTFHDGHHNRNTFIFWQLLLAQALFQVIKCINIYYYMALACGRYNARSDWLRARSEWSLCSRNAHGPITDYAN